MLSPSEINNFFSFLRSPTAARVTIHFITTDAAVAEVIGYNPTNNKRFSQ